VAQVGKLAALAVEILALLSRIACDPPSGWKEAIMYGGEMATSRSPSSSGLGQQFVQSASPDK